MNIVDQCLQGFRTHFLQSTDLLIKTTEEVREVRSWRADFSEELDNTLVILHSLRWMIAYIGSQRDRTGVDHLCFPRTVRDFRRLNGEN
jgi:hypothetical protein